MKLSQLPRNWRFWFTLAASIMLLAASFHPKAPLEHKVYRFLFVIDITQSMNSRDVQWDGQPLDRLAYTKEAIRHALMDLPCGSEAGLGLFTTRNTEVLFEPIEVCEHLPIIDDVLTHIDWRMAWAADSYIAEGLFNALRHLRKRSVPVSLAFFSDGQQTPEETIQPNFPGKPGDHHGLIVGVGGMQSVMIPKLDRDNQLIGYWEVRDIVTPVTTTEYQQAKPETPEFTAQDGYYLSRLHEDRLKRLAGLTGLEYHRLSDFRELSRALRAPAFAETRRVASDLSAPLAGAAGLLLLTSFLRWPRRRSKLWQNIKRHPLAFLRSAHTRG